MHVYGLSPHAALRVRCFLMMFVGSLSIKCAALRGSLWLPCIDRIALRDYFCLLCMLAGSCMRACAHTYLRTVPTYHVHNRVRTSVLLRLC